MNLEFILYFMFLQSPLQLWCTYGFPVSPNTKNEWVQLLSAFSPVTSCLESQENAILQKGIGSARGYVRPRSEFPTKSLAGQIIVSINDGSPFRARYILRHWQFSSQGNIFQFSRYKICFEYTSFLLLT